jgi:hypothetical protein
LILQRSVGFQMLISLLAPAAAARQIKSAVLAAAAAAPVTEQLLSAALLAAALGQGRPALHHWLAAALAAETPPALETYPVVLQQSGYSTKETIS